MKQKKPQKKYSLSRRITGLTIFLNSLFLVIIVVLGVFVFAINAEALKEKYALTESNSVVNATENFLDSIWFDMEALATSDDVEDYLAYINAGNDPEIPLADPNYQMYENVMLLMDNAIQHHEQETFSNVFIMTESSCQGDDDGCKILDDGSVVTTDVAWTNIHSSWEDDLGPEPYTLSQPYLSPLSSLNSIALIYQVNNQSNQTIGYVGAEISLSYLSTKVESFLDTSDNDILILSGYDQGQRLVYFTDPTYEDYLYKDLSEFSTIDAQNGFGDEGLDTVIQSKSDTLTDVETFSNRYLVTYTNIDDYHLQVIVMVYDDQPLSYEVLLIIVLGIVAILLLIIGFILNRHIKKSLQPIHDIIRSIEEIKNGNYQINTSVRENNEIAEIADAINLMSEEIERQVKLIYENFAYDQLTGLKNKTAMTKELNQTLFKGDKKTAVALLQVDNLKDIIIIKGQMMGDSLIQAIAHEIDALISGEDLLYSNGGNELIYIIPDFKSLSEVRDKVGKIIHRFKQPLIVNNVKSEIKIYAGIATYPSDDYNLDGLIKKCDVSIFKDKNTEKKQVIFYNDRISQEISYQAQVSEQLAQALENREIFLKYQPLIDIKSEIYGFEALARWSSPVLGNISPDIFISNAEENYLIIPIGTWILREACRFQVMLREKFNKEFVISVNVSVIQIMQNDYVDIVKRIIKQTDINPKYLTLELTESIFIKSTIALDDKIDDLHDMGVKFSLDDFGTGYASLTYLRNIAFDNLKIDKSFIDGILGAKKENRIVGTIVSLVHSLDMKVIAEGVEHKSQYEYLRQISTDIYQGFIMSKPLTVDEAIEFIDQFYKIAKSKRVDVLASQNE